ncbi:MAG: hypothetical protein EBT44_00385 [Actinobacteria bacterium]|uniref:Uncharacterized protein n=1 Tax=Candidatus Fonsibacter lacus TaxID=2576439 RepID=A0A965GC89_9PROT|nr:hypothetical protein [Candidatus Fonsibacter lacus]
MDPFTDVVLIYTLRFMRGIEQLRGKCSAPFDRLIGKNFLFQSRAENGDVPGWVLVVLMTAGLVTGIWTVAAPRLNLILKNSLDSINAIR